jgi:hypothetical protein
MLVTLSKQCRSKGNEIFSSDNFFAGKWHDHNTLYFRPGQQNKHSYIVAIYLNFKKKTATTTTTTISCQVLLDNLTTDGDAC